MAETERDSVVKFIQKHRKELHEADPAHAGDVPEHYLDQQVVLEGPEEKGNRVGAIFLVAIDDSHQDAKGIEA